MNNCTIIILGASGDLSRRKLLPQLYQLFKHQKDLNLLIVGAAGDDTTIAQILSDAAKHIKNKDKKTWDKFKACAYYHKIVFESQSDFIKLSKEVDEYEKQHNISGNRLIYLAAPANYYCELTTNIAESGLAKNQKKLKSAYHRIAYEKPFGWDLKSAKAINKCIKKYFDEVQIYRIDHYLTKSLVNSIAFIRFANILFEPTWNSKYIDHVQIILNETLDVEGRGAYYDNYGALKDVVQNHMLQIFSLISMDAPKTFNAEDISKAKSNVLKHTKVVDGLLGQYRGYLNESGVKKSSKTETFVVVELSLGIRKWSNVPFFLKTGKALNNKSTEIHVVYKQVCNEIFGESQNFEPNILTIIISPDAGFRLQLNAQKAGALNQIAAVDLGLDYECTFGPDFPHAYEVLLMEILKGDRSISVSPDEIENAWKIIDKINALKLPLYGYDSGSSGPPEAQDFIKKRERSWRL